MVPVHRQQAVLLNWFIDASTALNYLININAHSDCFFCLEFRNRGARIKTYLFFVRVAYRNGVNVP